MILLSSLHNTDYWSFGGSSATNANTLLNEDWARTDHRLGQVRYVCLGKHSMTFPNLSWKGLDRMAVRLAPFDGLLRGLALEWGGLLGGGSFVERS